MKREIIKMAAAVGFTLLILAIYCGGRYVREHDRLIAQIDRRLFGAAAAIPYVLDDDFHDRCLTSESIGPAEDRRHILELSALNRRLAMKFLYTVIRDADGTYRLTSSSATDDELKTGSEVRCFTDYPDASGLLKETFENAGTCFAKRDDVYHPVYAPIFSDRWGTYRSVFIPMRSPGGHDYIAAADMDISHVTALLRQNTLQTLLEYVIFTLSILPIVYAYINTVKRKSREYLHVQKLYLDHSQRSVTDPLTRIGNRRKLDEELQAAMEQYRDFGQPFGLVMIDIDHFKAINDCHGHQVGDAVLQQFAALLVDCSRFTDIVGRWGGEEFLIIYRNSNLEGAYRHAEKLRRVIEQTIFVGVDTISASFGVTQPIPGVTLEQLLSCVDKALYDAKNKGRNCIVKAPLEPNGSPE